MRSILAIETSTSKCGVALLTHQNGAPSCVVRETEGVSGHAQSVLPLVDEVLKIAEISRHDIDAVVFGQGPGAFTGLRVACGVAQGMGYALNVPVMPVGALESLAAAMPSSVSIRVVALDARMNEVYLAAWFVDPTPTCTPPTTHPATPPARWLTLQAPVLLNAQEALSFVRQRLPYWVRARIAGLSEHTVGFSGNGWAVVNVEADRFNRFASDCAPNLKGRASWVLCDDQAVPDVRWIAQLGWLGLHANKGLRPEQARPFYLRNKVAFTTVERAQGAGGNPKASDRVDRSRGDVARGRAAQIGVSECLVLPMLPYDVPEVADLERMSQAFPWSAQNFQDALQAGYPAWVVRHHDRLVGFCVGLVAPDEVHILVIAVHPDCQRHGVGTLLVEEVLQLAHQSGVSRVLLEVRPSNVRAQAFYQHHGFEQIGVRKGYYPSAKGLREDAYVMAVKVDHG